jgi:hypothetical protein
MAIPEFFMSLGTGCAEDDDEEHEGHHEFGYERRQQAVFSRRVRAVAVGGETSQPSPVTLGDDIENRRGRYGPENLRDYIGPDFLFFESAARPETEGNCRIEVRSGNGSQRIGDGQNGKPECDRYSQKPDSQARESRCKHGAAAAAENKPERSDKFGNVFSHV